MKAWVVFIKERFHPALYIPTVFLFVSFNVLLVTKAESLANSYYLVALIFVPVLCFFFRLRLFDEIKDYQTDVKINPDRPLARGLLQISSLKKVILSLIILESLWVFYISSFGFLFYSLAIAYSLLMYEEFYIGKWLSSKLTSYAISHTWVCAFLSIAIVYISVFTLHTTNTNYYFLGKEYWLIAIMNWLYFNYFEFARKTFASSEEKDGVASYSKIFGRLGAGILTFSQILIAFLIWYYFSKHYLQMDFPVYSLSLLALSFVTLLLYISKDSAKAANTYRAICGFILLLQYLALIVELGRI